jgi:hypothetical protein
MIGGGIFTSPTKGTAPGGIPSPVCLVGTVTGVTGIGGDMVGGGLITSLPGGGGGGIPTTGGGVEVEGGGMGPLHCIGGGGFITSPTGCGGETLTNLGGGFIVSRRLLITRSRIQSGSRGSGRGPGPLPHGIHLPLVDI